MQYPLQVEKDGDTLLVDVVDIPEAHTVIYDEGDLQQVALEAFESALEFYSETQRKIPLPRKFKKGQAVLYVPANLAAKIYLFNAWLDSNLSKKAMAEKLGVQPPAVSRLFDCKYRSKMEAIEAALKVLGKHLEVKVA